MSNSINHKIQKYTYKLKHARNSKEKAMYQSKLNGYKSQRGGELEKSLIEQLTETFNTTLGLDDKLKQNEETIANLGKKFDDLMAKLREQCCKGEKNCDPEVQAKLDAMKESYEKLIKTLATETGDKVKEKVKNFVDTESDDFKNMMSRLTVPCPPEAATAPTIEGIAASPGAKRKEALTKQSEKLANVTAEMLASPKKIPTTTGEPGEEVKASPGLFTGAQGSKEKKPGQEEARAKQDTGDELDKMVADLPEVKKGGGKRRLKY